MANQPQNQDNADADAGGQDLAAELEAMKAELAELREARRQKRAAKLMGEQEEADRPATDTQDKMIDAVETVLHHLKKDFMRDPPLAALGVAIVSGMATKALLARRQQIKRKVLRHDETGSGPKGEIA